MFYFLQHASGPPILRSGSNIWNYKNCISLVHTITQTILNLFCLTGDLSSILLRSSEADVNATHKTVGNFERPRMCTVPSLVFASCPHPATHFPPPASYPINNAGAREEKTWAGWSAASSGGAAEYFEAEEQYCTVGDMAIPLLEQVKIFRLKVFMYVAFTNPQFSSLRNYFMIRHGRISLEMQWFWYFLSWHGCDGIEPSGHFWSGC